MTVSRRVLPALCGVAAGFAVFSPGLASGDVAAIGISAVRSFTGEYRIEVEYSAAWGADQGEFAYTLLVTQKRAGQTIAVPLNETETIHPLDVCDDVCSGTCSVGEACHYKKDRNSPIYEGQCQWMKNLCPGADGKKTQQGCTCDRSDSQTSSVLQAEIGDVFTFSITPAPSLRGDDPSNNSLRITIQ